MKKSKDPSIRNEGGKTWIVEHFDSNQDLLIENVQQNQGVRIFGLNNCKVVIKSAKCKLKRKRKKKKNIQTFFFFYNYFLL